MTDPRPIDRSDPYWTGRNAAHNGDSRRIYDDPVKQEAFDRGYSAARSDMALDADPDWDGDENDSDAEAWS